MKFILTHIAFLLIITIIFGLFYLKGFSKLTFYASSVMLVSIAVIEAGMQNGFKKKLPKVKWVQSNLHLLRIVFGIILLSMANKIVGHSIIGSLLNSKSFIVVLWFWIVIEVLIDGLQKYKKR